MKRLNHILTGIIIILFLLHGIAGSLMLTGLSNSPIKWLSTLLLITVLCHAAISVLLTIQSVRSGILSGKWYLGANGIFWTKRISGIVILLLIIVHTSTYTSTIDGVFSLNEFTTIRMISQIIFAAVIFLHIFISVKGFLINHGAGNFKQKTVYICIILAIFLLIFTAAIIIYYIRWNVLGIYS